MPALKSAASATVLLTGVNGFLGAHIAQSLLESGYSVRGVVRSADKGEYLSKLFSCYGSKLQFTIVKDITAVRYRHLSCIPGVLTIYSI